MNDLSAVNLKPKNLEEALETISHLAQIIVELKEENACLKEQLNTNSKNSSLPPSSNLKRKNKQSPKVIEVAEVNLGTKLINAH